MNFARHQQGEEHSQAYDNKVDIADEVPLKSVRSSEEIEKL